VVSPPGHPHRSYQVAIRAKDGPFVDADAWQRDAAQQDGSWWPAWEAWLAARSGKQARPPAMLTNLGKAPGLYVLQP
jgi:polyhydroxyalkanoate synthase